MSQRNFILRCLPGTLDEIENKVRKQYPNILRSTIRGRLSEFYRDGMIGYELVDSIKNYFEVDE